jgi:hypothetical protein
MNKVVLKGLQTDEFISKRSKAKLALSQSENNKFELKVLVIPNEDCIFILKRFDEDNSKQGFDLFTRTLAELPGLKENSFVEKNILESSEDILNVEVKEPLLETIIGKLVSEHKQAS